MRVPSFFVIHVIIVSREPRVWRRRWKTGHFHPHFIWEKERPTLTHFLSFLAIFTISWWLSLSIISLLIHVSLASRLLLVWEEPEQDEFHSLPERISRTLQLSLSFVVMIAVITKLAKSERVTCRVDLLIQALSHLYFDLNPSYSFFLSSWLSSSWYKFVFYHHNQFHF